jgi:hypothetical protein
MGLLVGIGMMIGAVHAVSGPGSNQLLLPETLLHAEAATGCDTMAVATGAVGDDSEGLYTLDFITGELNCFVMYTQGGSAKQWGGTFKTSVIPALGAVEKGKSPNYLLVTGRADFRGTSAQQRPGYSIAYVVDTNTGNFAAYGVLWNKAYAASGNPQTGELLLLNKGTARSVAIRE